MLLEDKAEQLDATIRAIRGSERKLTNRDPAHLRRFTPVIVVHSKWPSNPVMHELAQLKLKELDLLQEADIDALEIITIEELEMVEAVQEAGGFALASLLERKRKGSMRGMGLKDHLLLVEKIEAGVSRRMDNLFTSLTERIVSTFGFPGRYPSSVTSRRRWRTGGDYC